MRSFSTFPPLASRFLAVAGSLFMLAGCQPQAVVERAPEPEPERVEEPEPAAVPPLTGQVFVIAPSGESIRLGSVRVQVFAEETIETHFREKERAVAREREELRARLVELEELASKQKDERVQAETAFSEREEAIRQKVGELKEALQEETESLQLQIDANSEFIAFSKEFPPPPKGIPSREEFEEYDRRRTKWMEMTPEERRTWVDVLTNLNAELIVRQKRLAAEMDEEIQSFTDELQVLDEKISAAGKAIATTAEKIERVKSDLNAPLEPTLLLSGLPAPLREVRTDAGGEFIVDLEPGRRYVVAAQAERRIHGEEAKYSWLVRVGGENGVSRLLLSDHNVTTSDAAENMVDQAAVNLESNT